MLEIYGRTIFLQATPDYSYYAYCVLCMETQMEQNIGLIVEMSKRLLKKPDATVDAVLKVSLTLFWRIKSNEALVLILKEHTICLTM